MSLKQVSVGFFCLFFIAGCASVSKRIAEAQPYINEINWPAEYLPEAATFYVHNKIEIDAAPQVVWDILIQAESWPQWYSGAAEVDIKTPGNTELEADSVFSWKTMGLRFESSVREFEPPYRLSWESRKSSIRGYHAWLIIPTDKGSLLITDESQKGWLAVLESVFQPDKLGRLHDIWLTEIKRKAEQTAG